MTELAVVGWAWRECTWQQSGDLSIGWMLEGRNYMKMVRPKQISKKVITKLAGIVEPRTNDGFHYRDYKVWVGNDPKVAPEMLEERMLQFFGQFATYLDTPDEFFREYEEIHPFGDGNGRTGSILWNWVRGTLDNPSEPPDFWNYRTEKLFNQLVESQPKA